MNLCSVHLHFFFTSCNDSERYEKLGIYLVNIKISALVRISQLVVEVILESLHKQA